MNSVDRAFTAAVSKGSGDAVLVFSADLLPYSETFIRDHVLSLSRYRAILVGGRKVDGLSTEDMDCAVLPRSLAARALLWFAGISPALDRIVAARKITLLHAHFADAGARLIRYARRRGLPLVVTLHGADVLRRRGIRLRDRMIAPLWHEMRRSADMFLPVSDYLLRRAADAGFPAERIRRHYLGIPLAEDHPRQSERAGPPTILFVGRLVEKKGLRYLIAACHKLAKQGIAFRLQVIGDGPLAAHHREEAKDLGDAVEFLGLQPTAAVRRQLASADIFCMPSIAAADGDNEGLGLVSLEAQAARLPVVAFAQGPIPEAVDDGVSGFLAADRSVDDLAAKIARLVRDPALRQRMGASGRQIVEQRFDILRQSAALEDLYDDVVAAHAGRRR